MENYAGFLEFADYHCGRLVHALSELGVLENMLVYYIIGDNGRRPRVARLGPSTRWPAPTAMMTSRLAVWRSFSSRQSVSGRRATRRAVHPGSCQPPVCMPRVQAEKSWPSASRV